MIDMRGALLRGLVGHPLDRKADYRRSDKHQGMKVQRRAARGDVHHQNARHHEHIAVGEVDQAQDTYTMVYQWRSARIARRRKRRKADKAKQC